MKLVLECGYTPAEAYNTGGDQNQACSICRIATDEPCFYQDAINFCSAPGREHHKLEPYLHNTQHKKMYAIYFERSMLTYINWQGNQVPQDCSFLIILNGESKRNSLAQATLDLSVIAKNVPFNVESVVVLSNFSFRKFIYKEYTSK